MDVKFSDATSEFSNILIRVNLRLVGVDDKNGIIANEYGIHTICHIIL